MLEAMDLPGHVILCIHLQPITMCKLACLARGVNEALAKMNNLVTKVNQFTFLRIHEAGFPKFALAQMMHEVLHPCTCTCQVRLQRPRRSSMQ